MLEFIDNSKFIDSVLLIIAGFMIGQWATEFTLKQKKKKRKKLRFSSKIKPPKKFVTINDLELWRK